MANSPVKVLVMAKDLAARQLVRRVCDGVDGIQVVSAAPDIRTGLAAVDRCSPDVVVLGLAFEAGADDSGVESLRQRHAVIPIILFGEKSGGTAARIRGLSRGANDFVERPTDTGPIAEAMVSADLIPKIRQLHRRTRDRRVTSRRISAEIRSLSMVTGVAPDKRRARLVAIGASTGGPDALTKLLSPLPDDLAGPVVIVQHMPAEFTKVLVKSLNDRCALTVVQAKHGMMLQAGEVAVCPGDWHMTLSRDGRYGRVSLNKEAPEHFCRPSVDRLFRSIAGSFGADTLGIVLTGMGKDGLDGSRRIQATGGTIMVQDEQSSAVWGMPGQVARAGIAEAILPLDELSKKIVDRAGQHFAQARRAG